MLLELSMNYGPRILHVDDFVGVKKVLGQGFLVLEKMQLFFLVWFLIQDMMCWLIKVEAFLSIFFRNQINKDLM